MVQYQLASGGSPCVRIPNRVLEVLTTSQGAAADGGARAAADDGVCAVRSCASFACFLCAARCSPGILERWKLRADRWTL